MSKDVILTSQIDPSEHGDFVSSIKNSISRAMLQVDGMLPASIVSYSKGANTATVKIMIDMLKTDGGTLQRPILYNIPVYRYGGGGFFVGIDLKSGDTGWIKANDRDISGFMASGIGSIPSSKRVKNFSDGVFYPDTMAKGGMIDGALVIQNLNGTSSISLTDSVIILKVGGVSLQIDQSGLTISAPSIKHNGVEIGKDHTNGGAHIP